MEPERNYYLLCDGFSWTQNRLASDLCNVVKLDWTGLLLLLVLGATLKGIQQIERFLVLLGKAGGIFQWDCRRSGHSWHLQSYPSSIVGKGFTRFYPARRFEAVSSRQPTSSCTKRIAPSAGSPSLGVPEPPTSSSPLNTKSSYCSCVYIFLFFLFRCVYCCFACCRVLNFRDLSTRCNGLRTLFFYCGLSVPGAIQVRMKCVTDVFSSRMHFSPTIADSCIGLLLNLRIELLEITPARNYAMVSASHQNRFASDLLKQYN